MFVYEVINKKLLHLCHIYIHLSFELLLRLKSSRKLNERTTNKIQFIHLVQLISVDRTEFFSFVIAFWATL